jgi:hypothetical protein
MHLGLFNFHTKNRAVFSLLCNWDNIMIYFTGYSTGGQEYYDVTKISGRFFLKILCDYLELRLFVNLSVMSNTGWRLPNSGAKQPVSDT